jgi:hypothetical protein
MSVRPAASAHPLKFEVLGLLQVAMIVFVYTVVIGILNGTDAVDFNRKTVLAHVHMGTLGWITMCVFAASFWLFGEGPSLTPLETRAARWLTISAILTFPVYALAFMFTHGHARPGFGSLALLIIVGVFIWVIGRARKVELTTPHWGFLAAVGTSVAGGVLGVLLGLRIATGDKWLPSGGEDAHPATMVFGFLLPVGMALAEWCFAWPRPAKATRLGIWQMSLQFTAGVILGTGLLLDLPPIIPLAALANLAGVAIFIKRMWPHLRSVQWAERSIGRFAFLSSVSIVVNLVLVQYFVIRFKGDLDKVPPHQILALDHTMFIGVMTSAIFGLMLATTTRREAQGAVLDHAVFVAIAVGLLGFATGLLFDVTILKQLFTPILGSGLILGLALYTFRLRTRSEEAASAIGAVAVAGGG